MNYARGPLTVAARHPERMARLFAEEGASRGRAPPHRSFGRDSEWPWLTLPVEVGQAKNRVGMQWADIAGRAMLKATTPGASPPHRTEPVYLETLAPVIWRRRRIETYGIKSVMPDWHLTQPWWKRVTDAMPIGEA